MGDSTGSSGHETVDLDAEVIKGAEQFTIQMGDQDGGESPDGSGDRRDAAGDDPAGAGASPGETGDRQPEGPKGGEPEGGGDANHGWKPRFQSHEEAERGFREIQSKITRAEQENADLRKQLDRFEEQQRESNVEKSKADRRKFYREARADALKRIGDLDPDAPDHSEQVADIWAEADDAIADYNYTHMDDFVRRPEQADAGGDQGADHDDAGDLATGHDDAGDQGAGDGNEDAFAYIDRVFGESGLDPDDRVIFDGLAKSAPSVDENGRPLSFEDQVSRTIAQTRQYKERRFTRSRQELGESLSRGSNFQPPAGAGGGGGRPGPVKPMSLDDALEDADNARLL